MKDLIEETFRISFPEGIKEDIVKS